jgi:membrane-associated phospholipid phosphatase
MFHYAALQRLWRAEVFYSTFLLAFAVLAVFAHYYAHFGWDVTIQGFLRQVPRSEFTGLMRLISTLGDGKTPHFIAVLTTVLFFFMHLRSEAAGLFLSTTGSGLINMGLKLLIARPRPALEPATLFMPYFGNSFPSGHVTFFVSYFGFLFFVGYALLPRGSMVRRLALLFAPLLIILIGISRVHLNAHWPSDTLGGYLLGGLWLAFSLDMYRRWKARLFKIASER